MRRAIWKEAVNALKPGDTVELNSLNAVYGFRGAAKTLGVEVHAVKQVKGGWIGRRAK